MRLGGLYMTEKPNLKGKVPQGPLPPNLSFIRPTSVEEFDDIVPQLDNYGLSAIGAPYPIENYTPEECARFGEKARELGIMVGEASNSCNLMASDQAVVDSGIESVRKGLQNADLMQCRTLHILVGTKEESGGHSLLAAHPYMYTDECKSELREVVLRIMDGLDLKHTRFLIEPFNHTFFYQPEDIREFLDSVGHPMVGVQGDVVNMIAFDSYFDTTSLINRAFDLLSEHIYAAHIKDMAWDYGHLSLKWDEVLIGKGTFDITTYLKRLDQLDPETPVYTEHLPDEQAYAHNFAQIYDAARDAGVTPLTRSPKGTN